MVICSSTRLPRVQKEKKVAASKILLEKLAVPMQKDEICSLYYTQQSTQNGLKT